MVADKLKRQICLGIENYSKTSQTKDNIGDGAFVPCREVVLFSKVFLKPFGKSLQTKTITLKDSKMYYYNVFCAYILTRVILLAYKLQNDAIVTYLYNEKSIDICT